MPDAQVTVQQQFEQFLAQFPEQLANLVAIIQAYLQLQNAEPATLPTGPGPKKWNYGDPVQLTTDFITHEQIDALQKGYAEAAVKERAIAFVRGFIMGLSIAAGGLA